MSTIDESPLELSVACYAKNCGECPGCEHRCHEPEIKRLRAENLKLQLRVAEGDQRVRNDVARMCREFAQGHRDLCAKAPNEEVVRERLARAETLDMVAGKMEPSLVSVSPPPVVEQPQESLLSRFWRSLRGER